MTPRFMLFIQEVAIPTCMRIRSSHRIPANPAVVATAHLAWWLTVLPYEGLFKVDKHHLTLLPWILMDHCQSLYILYRSRPHC